MALGFLMTGGASSRMRRPKALLPWYHRANAASGNAVTLAEHLCATLRTVCQDIFLVGDLPIVVEGIRRLPDAIPGLGPVGGLITALEQPGDCWRLVSSCDTPFISPEFLRELVQTAGPVEDSTWDAVVPRTGDGQLHPLCALYHSRSRETLRRLLTDQEATHATQTGAPKGKRRAPSMHRFLRQLRVKEFPVADDHILYNLNTMQDYLAALGGHQAPNRH